MAGQRKSSRIESSGPINMHYAMPSDAEEPDSEPDAYVEGPPSDDGTAAQIPLYNPLVEIFERCEAYDTTQLVEDTRKIHDKLLTDKDDQGANKQFNFTFKHCLEKAAEFVDIKELAEFGLAYLLNIAAATHHRAVWKSRRDAFMRDVVDLLLQGASTRSIYARRLCCEFLSALHEFKTVLGSDRTKHIMSLLIDRAYDTDAQVRVMALRFIGKTGYSRKSVEPVLFAIEQDPNVNARLAAVEALPLVMKDGIEDKECLNLLAGRIRDRHARVREAALEALKAVDLATLADALTHENERCHHRLNLLLKGVKDHTESVAKATMSLVEQWLNETPGDFLSFLEKLNVVPTSDNDEYFERASSEKECVVRAIFQKAERYDIDLDLSDMVQTGMTPEQAYMLRSFCQFGEETHQEVQLPTVARLMEDITARHERLLSLLREEGFDQEQYTAEDYILGQLLQVLGNIIEADISTDRDEVDQVVVGMLRDPVAMARHVKQLFLIRKKCGTTDFVESSLSLFEEVKLETDASRYKDDEGGSYALVVLAAGIAANSGQIHDETQLQPLLEAVEQGFNDEEHKMETLKAYGWLSLTSLEGVHTRLQFLVNFYQELAREIEEAEIVSKTEIAELEAQLEEASDELDRDELVEQIRSFDAQLDGDTEQHSMQQNILFILADIMMTFKFQDIESFRLLKDGLSAEGQVRAICVHLISQLLFAECVNKQEETALLGKMMALFIEHHSEQAVAYAVGGKTVSGVKDTISLFSKLYCCKEDSRRKVARVVVKELYNKFDAMAVEVTVDQERLKDKDPARSTLTFNVEDTMATYRNIMSEWIKLLAKSEIPIVENDRRPRRSCLVYVLQGVLQVVTRIALSIKNEAATRREIKHKKMASRPYHDFNVIMGDSLKLILQAMESGDEEMMSTNLAEKIIALCEEVVDNKQLGKEHLGSVRRLAEKMRSGVRSVGDDTAIGDLSAIDADASGNADDEDDDDEAGDRSFMFGTGVLKEEDLGVTNVVHLHPPSDPIDGDDKEDSLFYDAVDTVDAMSDGHGDSDIDAGPRKRQRVDASA